MTNLKNYKAGVEKSAQMGDIFTHHNYDTENVTYHFYRVRTDNTTNTTSNTLLTHYYHHNYDPENAIYHYYRVRTANTTDQM